MLGMLKPPPFNCCHFSASTKKSPFSLHPKTVSEDEKEAKTKTTLKWSQHPFIQIIWSICVLSTERETSLTVFSVSCQMAYVLINIVSLLISHEAQLKWNIEWCCPTFSFLFSPHRGTWFPQHCLEEDPYRSNVTSRCPVLASARCRWLLDQTHPLWARKTYGDRADPTRRAISD